MSPPRQTQTEGAKSSSAGSSLGRLVLELCLGKEGAKTCKVLEKILIIESTENSSFAKIQFGHQKLLQPERPVSSLGCACVKQVLEASVQSFVTYFKSVQNVPKDLLGQAGNSIGVFEFCDLIPATVNWASMRRYQI
jgi:hypothetical protein